MKLARYAIFCWRISTRFGAPRFAQAVGQDGSGAAFAGWFVGGDSDV
jgi:hypothetical protein